MNTGTLAIQRVNCTYLAPTDHPAPENLRWRIDDVVRKNLPPLFERTLAQTFDSGDESIWIIRKLDVDLAVDVGSLDDHALARAWTQQLATRLARIVSAGADGDGILHFPNRAAYLAQFARDLSRGSAWGKWYYAEFDTLRQLPDGTALVEAWLRQPAHGMQALVALSHQDDFERVLSILTSTQAVRLLDGLAAGHTQHSEREAASLLLASWDAARLGRSPRPALYALRLLTNLLQAAPPVSLDPSILEAMGALLDLASALDRNPDALISLLRHIHLPGSNAATGMPLESGTLDWLTRAAQGDADWLLQTAQIIAPRALANVQGARPTARASTMVTRFGGLAHLLKVWTELNLPHTLDQACASLPEEDRERTAQALRLSLAMHDFGPETAFALSADEGALSMLGIQTPFAPAEMQARLNLLPRSTLVEVVADHLRALAQLGAVEQIRPVVETISPQDGSQPALIVRDADTGYWLDAQFLDRALAPEEARAASLRHTAQAMGQLDLIPSPDIPTSTEPESKAQQDWAQLSLAGTDWNTGILLDLTLSLLAHNTLRRLAHRLRGFERSSAAYLRANFLESTATLTFTREALNLRLTQPPLGMLLRLAGLDEYDLALPWLPGQPVHVEMELPL